MSESILTSTKKVLGIGEVYTAFDEDIIMHINSAFSTLNELGLGPVEGFRIDDASAVWSEFTLDDARLNSVKTYVYLRVRLLFDPPTTSYLVEALNKEREQLEWRLNTIREATAWVDPTPIVLPGYEEDIIIDGGSP